MIHSPPWPFCKSVYRLRAAGYTILCIEHHADILSRADFLVELGPGSGDDSDRIVSPGYGV